jgi:hypothetical protein
MDIFFNTPAKTYVVPVTLTDEVSETENDNYSLIA